MSDIQTLAARRRTFILLLGGITAALTAIHLVLQAVRFIEGNDYMFGLTPLFDLDAEGNIPTLFSTILLLTCAGLLAYVATHARQRNDSDAPRWMVLAAGFLFMAIDEFAKVHELLDKPMQSLMGDAAGGALSYTWVVPYSIIVLALGAYFLKFLWRLPAATRWRFMLAGTIYVGAALGIEFLEGAQASAAGEGSIGYATLTTIQEILEMSAAILFLDALLRYIHDRGITVAPHPGQASHVR